MATKRKRKSISTTTRFEVFKRDSFKCQYCGRCAPEVVLELDHIDPHSKGGTDDVLNLITSCWACNNGKSDRTLDDSTVIAKQRTQIEELQERREQLEMLLRWRDANLDLDQQAVDAFSAAYTKRTGWVLSDSGKLSVRKLIRKSGLQASLEALDRSADQYLRYDKNGKVPQDVADKVFGAIWVFAQPDDVRVLYLFRGIARKRCKFFDDHRAIALLKKARKAGASDDELREIAMTCANWSDWQAQMANLIASILGGE